MEFPNMQEAWLQRSDRVAVIALSIEPSDTLDVLHDYAMEKGLTFPSAASTAQEWINIWTGLFPPRL